MTGREQKVYYSYSQMSNKHSVPHEGPPSLTTRDQKASGFAVPELEHNLQLLIDLTEQNILQVRVNIPSNNWLYFVSYLFITLDYWSWYNSHFLKVYNTYIILDVIYVKENSTPCRVSHLKGVWLVCLYNLPFSVPSCLVSSLLMPVVCQTSAAWERHSCVSDPRGKSAAYYTGHWAKGNPENGGCTGTGGSFSFWGDGTRRGTHPAGEHTRQHDKMSYLLFIEPVNLIMCWCVTQNSVVPDFFF